MKKIRQASLADSVCEIRARKIKTIFFDQINKLLDWNKISQVIGRYYQRGKSATGAPSYDGVLLFKMCLLQTWYGLSDYEVEDRVNDSISFSYFCGLSIEQVAPEDHSTVSRFRTAMTKAKAYEPLLKEINTAQLERQHILVKTGVIVDASVINSPLKPKGRMSHNAHENEQEIAGKKEYPASVDREASWVRKGNKLYYGYKKHYITDGEGLVLGVVSTKASTNEVANLEAVLESVALPENIALKADKGYQSAKNARLLKERKIKNHILKKAKRNKGLTHWERKFNILVGKTRFKVERTFGSIKRWCNGGVARYRGIAKMHTQNIMEAISYNLYRSPGILASHA